MEITTAISIAISIAAFALSVTALWQTHFAKFNLVSAIGNLQIRIYPFRHKKEKWYIPCIDVPISLTNKGAQVGKVLGLRIRASFPDSQTPNNYQILIPRWEVDYKKFESISDQRFEWIDKAVLGEWMPFVVLPKQTVTKHLVFETEWDNQITQDNVNFELEIYTNVKKKWRKIAKWEATLAPEIWSKTLDTVSSFIFTETSSESIDLEEYKKSSGAK